MVWFKNSSSMRIFSIFSPLRKIRTGLLLASGSAVAFLFIAFALLVDVQALAVLLAALGTGLGVLIVSLSAPKWFVTLDKERQKQLEIQLQSALQSQAQSAAELERLRSQRLQIEHIEACLKLTLLEVDTVFTDFKRQDLGARDKTLGGAERLEYIGAVRNKAKVMLGIDLSKLRVEQKGTTLCISGLESEFQGLRNMDEEWLLSQIHIHEDNMLLSNKIRIHTDHQLLLPATQAHRKELQERLQNGSELKVYDIALEKMAQQWLTLLLTPLGFHLEFSSQPSDQALLLTQFLRDKLLQIENQTIKLNQPPSFTSFYN